MTQTFKALLDQKNADSDTVQQAARYFIAEQTDDLTPQEMRDELVKAVGDTDALDEALSSLRQDSLLLENSALVVLSNAWQDSSQQVSVENSIDSAKGKLPVIEIGILTLAIMYGMYLISTGGVKKATTTVIRREDGSLEEKNTIEYFDSTGPLSALTNLFKK